MAITIEIDTERAPGPAPPRQVDVATAGNKKMYGSAVGPTTGGQKLTTGRRPA